MSKNAETSPPRFHIARLNEIEPVPCPCGQARRAFLDDPEKTASLHQVTIKADSQTHYHKRQTEIYYILDGTGLIELDGRHYPVSSGDSIMIKPCCRHRAIGELTLLNIVVPAFDPEDEWFD